MIYIEIEEQTNKVIYENYKPFDKEDGLGKTREQLEQEGILVDSIPEPEQIEEKQAILYCSPNTKKLWYEYKEIPKTKEEIENDKINSLVQTIAQLSVENKKKDVVTATLAQTIATLNLRINKLEKEGR